MLTRNFFQNRDFFRHFLELELKRSLRYQSFTSVLLIEIPPDRKVPVSKTSFLERVANSLSSQVRVTDIIGTTRENSITVVLLNCDKCSASEVANRVTCWSLQYFGTDNINDGASGSSVAIGAACFPTHATDSEHLLGAATEMLETSRRLPEAQSRFQP